MKVAKKINLFDSIVELFGFLIGEFTGGTNDGADDAETDVMASADVLGIRGVAETVEV